MQLSDKIKKFSVEQAIDYLNRNPVKNLPKLLDLGCLFIWYFHYMPVGNDASPGRQPPRRKRSKTRAKNAKKLCAKNAKAPSPSRETVLFPAVPSRGRPGHTVPHREKRHQRCRCCAA